MDWTTSLLTFIRDHGYRRVESSQEIERAWGAHVEIMAGKILFGRQQSWFTGYNSNVDRAYAPKIIVYAGGAVRYRERVGQEAEQGYPDFGFA